VRSHKEPHFSGNIDSSKVVICVDNSQQHEGNMKLMLGKPDDSELMLAEQVSGAWRPNPKLAAEMAAFLQGADPEQFEMWVEEPE
jgi:hypothetical protein